MGRLSGVGTATLLRTPSDDDPSLTLRYFFEPIVYRFGPIHIVKFQIDMRFCPTAPQRPAFSQDGNKLFLSRHGPALA
jgi:hypothetical protein